MSDDATKTSWGYYVKAKAERGYLDPLVIGDEEFIFPASPPAELVMNILEVSKGGSISNDDAARLIKDLIGADKAERLAQLTTWEEFSAIMNDLLEQYGIATKKGEGGDGDPNRAARRASGRKSSRDSARSKQTSAASTG